MIAEKLESPRWKNGPRICSATNVPAFNPKAAAMEFHEANGPGCHVEDLVQCVFCDQWHFKSTARGPGGESSGTGRFSKHAK